MVSINYRVEYGILREEIIEFFKSLGYTHLGKRNSAVKTGNKNIPTEVFIKDMDTGRFHLFIEFGKKRSGTEAYPQVIVHAHFDLYKKKGNKEFHLGRHDFKKDLDEMYDIHGAMKEAGIGFMEYKSQNVWHGTIKRTYKKLLKRVIERDYELFEEDAYKKKVENGQITFQIITQVKYLHLICIYAIGKRHDLNRDKAREEMDRILNEMKTIVEER